MSDSQCMAINPAWHKVCRAKGEVRLVVDGNQYAVCDSCLCVGSVADTWKGDETNESGDSVVIRTAKGIAEMAPKEVAA